MMAATEERTLIVNDVRANITDGGYLYMIQSYRDICISPEDAVTLAKWILKCFADKPLPEQQ